MPAAVLPNQGFIKTYPRGVDPAVVLILILLQMSLYIFILLVCLHFFNYLMLSGLCLHWSYRSLRWQHVFVAKFMEGSMLGGPM